MTQTSKAANSGVAPAPQEAPTNHNASVQRVDSPNRAQQSAQPAKKDTRPKVELTEAQKRELRQAFDLFDAEGTGRIPSAEVKVALRALGFEVRKEELKQLLADIGTTVAGTLDFNEFLRVLMYKIGEKESKEEVQRAFRLFDEQDKGYICFEDLKQLAKSLGHGYLTDDELAEMLAFAMPASANAKRERGVPGSINVKELQITEEDFMRLMKRASIY